MKTASLFRSAAAHARSISIRSSHEIRTVCVAARSLNMPAFIPAMSLKIPFCSSPSFFASPSRKISSASIITYASESCSCGEAYQKLSAGSHQYLDVRSPGEFEAGHAENAVNIPVFFMNPGGMSPNPDFLSQVEASFPAKDIDLLVACAAGKRSAAAVAILESAGYTSLVDVQGGWNAWVSEGLPTSKK